MLLNSISQFSMFRFHSFFYHNYSYGKTKDAFGWPEEPEDIPAGQSTPAQATAGVTTGNDADNPTISPTPLTSVDK